MHDFNANGTNGNLGSVKLGDEYKPGEYNDLKVVVVGSTITTYVNGVMVSQIENSKFSSGSVGFRNGGSEVCSYDYIRVSEMQLTASADLTAEAGISAFITDLDGETEIDRVIVNRDMLIHVTTPVSIEKLRLYNEYGLRISHKLISCTEQNGQKQWVISARLGTVGQNRTLTVVPMNANGELTGCSVDLPISIVAADPVLYSAEFTAPTSVANRPITLKAVTSADVVRIDLYNEYGLKVSTQSRESVQNADGTLTWTVSTKIGTAGSRVITVKAFTKYGTSDSSTAPVRIMYF